QVKILFMLKLITKLLLITALLYMLYDLFQGTYNILPGIIIAIIVIPEGYIAYKNIIKKKK
ncbi:hypothetical protein, partial [Lactococcus petauri]|uniref:hypothetical protein n=2 Tax=Streptococcaceae TaxID=1300 RepID=UPI0022E5119B